MQVLEPHGLQRRTCAKCQRRPRVRVFPEQSAGCSFPQESFLLPFETSTSSWGRSLAAN